MTEEDVFLAALDLPDAAARALYLERICGRDSGLRQQLVALLAAHYESGEFLDVPAAEQMGTGTTEGVTLTMQGDVVSDEKTSDDETNSLHFLKPSTRPGSLGRIGHYEVLEVINKGGFGIVFRAFDDVLKREVAVKVMAPQIAATSPARKRFLREARSSAAVRHENVVQVYEVAEHPLPYLVMEFIPGESLQQLLARIGPLEVAEVLRIGNQIAEGLAAAHATDLIHRDIKPSNILMDLGTHGSAKITDFGLARAADDASISQSGIIAGTPMFMAPEQALGHKLDQRADLFSFGSVLYQMVSGRPPFRASPTLAVLKRVVEEAPRPIQEIIPETPTWLCDIIAKLHAKNPDDRFQSAREVADVLTNCENQLKTYGRLKDFSRIPRAKTKRAWWWKWMAAATIVFLPVFALGVTELARVTQLFRGLQSTHDPIKPDGDPTLVVVAKQELPVPVAKLEQLLPTTAGWTFLKPFEMKSEGGATLTLLDDGSILAGGEHPSQDSYSLTFRDLPSKIQALRLEVLPHNTLPKNGPGRHPSGRFCLTTIKFQLDLPKSPNELRFLKLSKAWADNCRGDDSEVQFAIDADDNTGWVTEVGKPHFAVFELAEPFFTTASMVLRATLEFKPAQRKHELGCFRLSVSKESWNEEDANKAVFEDWLKRIAALPALEQVEELRKELKKRNPEFDGTLTPTIRADAVIGLKFNTDRVTDISPVQALTRLQRLDIGGPDPGKGSFMNLSQLKGMSLTVLVCNNTMVADLTPLKGMPLTALYCDDTNVSDLEALKGMSLRALSVHGTSVESLMPLKGMPLNFIGFAGTKVSNLSPLEGMPLTELSFSDAPVSDLAPLNGMPLEMLHCARTKVADLAPLKGMKKLAALHCERTKVADLSPLKEIPLKMILCDFQAARDAKILRAMKTLETINGKPVEEFWKDVKDE